MFSDVLTSNDISNIILIFFINVFLIGVLAPTLVNYIKNRYLTEAFSKKVHLKQLFLQDISIKNCYEYFDNITSSKNNYLFDDSFFALILLGGILSFIYLFTIFWANLLLYSLYFIFGTEYRNFIERICFFVAIVLMSLVPMVLTNHIKYYMNEKTYKRPFYLPKYIYNFLRWLFRIAYLSKSSSYVEDYKKVKLFRRAVLAYSASWLLTPLSIYNIYGSLGFIGPYIILVYIVLYPFVFLSILVSFLSTKSYIEKLKNEINDKYKENYPYVRISTIGGHEGIGRIENAFITDSISLIDSDCKTTIMCSSVDMITIEK